MALALSPFGILIVQPTHLGPYTIEKLLGKGGMGSVYVGVDPASGQQVAIKALSPHLAMAEGFRERFEAEIESLKTLRHDGIVRLFGYGEQDGTLFYSMELVEGHSLEEELKAGRRFNWREVSSIAIQVALALKHAHDHGIVHRDIKPANILLSGQERVKLADFGIARLFGATSLTTAGGVLGTADYMSPEQADGRPVTARCDQYSLGGAMYALLAGRPPFRAKNLPQMLQMQRFANPEPVRRYAPDTPEQLEQLIMQLLAKEPADRFPNTQVLARHLQAMVNALSRPAADDFALPEDLPPGLRVGQVLHESISTDETKLEQSPGVASVPVLPVDKSGRTLSAFSSQNAATVAADSKGPSISLPVAPAAIAAGGNSVPAVIERASHFTTVEEEEAARQAAERRSWLLVAAQVASLAAILGGVAMVFFFVTRPQSADKLYAAIHTQIEHDDDASLLNAEREIAEFLERYSEDRRSEELRGYQERIELLKLERRLQRWSRLSASSDASLLPAEQLYLEGVAMAASDPEAAVSTLHALIDLYRDSGPSVADDSARQSSAREAAERTASVVQLATRRLKTLESQVSSDQRRKLAAIEERFKAARALKESHPDQAAAMFRAIVTLYDGKPWAQAAVAEARQALAEMEKK